MREEDLLERLGATEARLDQLQAEDEEKDKEIVKLKDANISQRHGLRQLRDELSRVEAERDAAVKDMKLMADKAREEHGDSVPCFVCRFDCDMSIMPSGNFANECPGFDKDDCFEWRGPQGGGVNNA